MMPLLLPLYVAAGVLLACLASAASASTSAAQTEAARTLPASSRADVSACELAANRDVAGTLRAFMLFVDFPDAPATGAGGETPQSLRDFFLPAAAEWYAQSSYGALALDVTADVSRFHRMPAASTSYGWERGLAADTHYRYIQDALDARRGAVPPTDVLYVAPTARARALSFSPTFMGSVAARGGAHVARKAVTFGLDAYEAWGALVLNHETGHAMCLADYYPASGAAGLHWRLGWLADDQVDCVAAAPGSTTHALTPLARAGGPKAVVVRRDGANALVAELRAASGLDAAACAAGVLLYTVLRGTRSYTLADWGVTVTVTKETADSVEIKVEVS
ncbi:M6 metalloprotease [Durotheca rogersii]|uniref:M6 metalloprotease n=1 Tax=Durotheca rogersii TaxID=419775 RepID=UPI00221EF830|nr:M6 metalloprotease [Durotheca rogersii]KAI5863841.1 M6 metalloprotease [Durotheca rogersii]